jgi:simple sugar transport system ATP-binding protein
VSKRYSGVVALENVNLELHKGEIHGLVGENGSGKSTLVKIITGVVKPEPGSKIVIEGKSYSYLTPLLALREGIHVVHQDLSLFPNLTVAENIAIHKYVEERKTFVNWKDIKEVARETLEKLGIEMDLDVEVGSLPLADQQLVAICRAIASDAKLVIMDEPTSSLTSKEVERLFDFMNFLRKRGITILFISHRLDEILEITQRITVLRDGKKIGTFERAEVDKKKLVYLMTGKEISYSRSTRNFKEAKKILEIKNLTKKGQFENISFSLHEKEILGIIGPRGSGRTELALSLFGMNPPDSGEIYVYGQRVNIRSNQEAIRLGIGYVPENRLLQGLVLDHSVANNIVITNLKKLLGKFNLIDGRRKRKLAESAIKAFGIKTAGIEVPVKTLSGGNQQKVVLAKWILTAPKILILDGPTIGIDVAAKGSIYKLIKDLSERGVSIILISDEPAEVINNCDRILLMKNGRIQEEFSPNEITEEELNRKIKE